MNQFTLRNDLVQMQALRFVVSSLPTIGAHHRDAILQDLQGRIELTETAIEMCARPSDIAHPRNHTPRTVEIEGESPKPRKK